MYKYEGMLQHTRRKIVRSLHVKAICKSSHPLDCATRYLTTSVHSTFKFKTINNATTLQYLSNLTNSYSCGHDNINNTLLKSISNEISSSITLIEKVGSYPENLKLAKELFIFLTLYCIRYQRNGQTYLFFASDVVLG